MRKLVFLLSCVLSLTAMAELPFVPAATFDDIESAPGYYIYEGGNAVYLKELNENLSASGFTGDKFVFIADGETGKYYIYNRTTSHYIYYVSETANSNVQKTSESMVRFTADRNEANSWKIVDDDQQGCVDIVPGSVENVTATTQGWNFRGGVNCVLNLYDRSDRNSHWSISGSLEGGRLACATHVFSLPNAPFMHKLVAKDGDVVSSVTGLPEGLELYSDRSYKYIRGTAPASGNYTYTVHVNEGTNDAEDVEITFDVSDDLTQPLPFMGILTWNAFQNNINTSVIEKISDALVDYGLVDLGYKYMCIDDQWAQKNRDSSGKLQVNTSKFDADLSALTDYVHKNGQKIGIYSDAGSYTCSGAQPGSYGKELSDAKQFVGWGFDLLKYDFCNATGGTSATAAEKAYSAMGEALDKAMTQAGKQPKDFLFYMCEWGYRQPWLWGAETGATCWRATDDTRDFWSDTTYKGGIVQSINTFKTIWSYQGVNRWNDADMLVVGLHGTGYSSNDGGGAGYSAGLTQNEARTNFSLWCMWSSPLTLSNNITNLDGKANTLTGKTVTNSKYKDDLDIIRNAELIALDQDTLGQSAEPILDTDDYIVFAKDCANGDVAVSITNLSKNSKTISVDLSKVPGLEAGCTYNVRDLWKHEDLSKQYTTEDTYKATSVATHLTKVLRFSKVDPTSGIACTTVRTGDAPRYDIQGRKVSPAQKGIVIVEGQKTLQK